MYYSKEGIYIEYTFAKWNRNIYSTLYMNEENNRVPATYSRYMYMRLIEEVRNASNKTRIKLSKQ